MSRKRRTFSARFKAGVALEAIQGMTPINEIASTHGVHPNQVSAWKKQAVSSLPEAFHDGRAKRGREQEDLTAHLYQQIGQLKVELDWIKKKSGMES
jgi:transposase-like protein